VLIGQEIDAFNDIHVGSYAGFNGKPQEKLRGRNQKANWEDPLWQVGRHARTCWVSQPGTYLPVPLGCRYQPSSVPVLGMCMLGTGR
jgi:hypothetical protein